MMKNRMRRLINILLLSTTILSQLHVVFRGLKTRVDWFLFIEYTRRIDFAVMYLCTSIIFLIYSIALKYKHKINPDITSFIVIINSLDLIHYFATSRVGFGLVKLFCSILIFVIYKLRFKIVKTWRNLLYPSTSY